MKKISKKDIEKFCKAVGRSGTGRLIMILDEKDEKAIKQYFELIGKKNV